MAEIAVEFGLKHVPIVEKNKNGTPFISDMMHQARSRAAPGNYLCMINADIILLQEFYDAYYATYEFFDGGPGGKGVSDERTWTEMLMIGCRYNLDLDHELNFAGDWVGDLKTYVRPRTRLVRARPSTNPSLRRLVADTPRPTASGLRRGASTTFSTRPTCGPRSRPSSLGASRGTTTSSRRPTRTASAIWLSMQPTLCSTCT